jgi:3-methylcrotonyl-CoA carboxylase alpha subunit
MAKLIAMQVINKILIANRGEIARRIIRTAKRLGIGTVAIYTEEEKNAPHVLEAGQAYSLGAGNLAETYLNIPRIINIAKTHGCDAIHPGYGFLSENGAFAQACEDANIVFIGPSPESIRLMGNKKEARSYVEKIGIQLPISVSGHSFADVKAQVAELKFPLMIKAVAGGGGKGMKIIYTVDELTEAWESASREALSYFGNSELYLEQYIEDARHIEVQILGDAYGNVIHLFERECTIQRRYQKIIEEAPSATLTDDIRQKLLETALHIVQSLHYKSAGTMEFLFDKDLNFYFLEMNTRIQVEHPVTEAITGIDIVEEQIRIAEGQSLRLKQSEIQLQGHAIECRIYAEDSFSGFTPSSGNITLFHFPQAPGIRIDSAFDKIAHVSSSFDPMIAKVISFADSREQSIRQMNQYLKSCAIHGITTNLEYLLTVLEEKDFANNVFSIEYCKKKGGMLVDSFMLNKKRLESEIPMAVFLANRFGKKSDSSCIWQSIGPWRHPGVMSIFMDQDKWEVSYKILGKQRISFNLNSREYLIEDISNQEAKLVFLLNGRKNECLVSEDESGSTYFTFYGLSYMVKEADLPDENAIKLSKSNLIHKNGNDVHSPLNGRVIKLNVNIGDKVKKGELLMIIESMKMENRIVAPAEAMVLEIMVSIGDQVIGKELLVKLSMLN